MTPMSPATPATSGRKVNMWHYYGTSFEEDQ